MPSLSGGSGLPTKLLMPDGSTRPLPSWHYKPQYEWTEEEAKEAAALQEESLEMQRRLAPTVSGDISGK